MLLNVYASNYLNFCSFRYAHSTLNEGDLWTDLTVEELKAFFGIFIVMGIKKLPALNMYWSENEMLGCPWIIKTMSCKRFTEIIRFLHLVDNALMIQKDQPGYNPLFKITPLLDHLKIIFSRWYSPKQGLSVDEARSAAALYGVFYPCIGK